MSKLSQTLLIQNRTKNSKLSLTPWQKRRHERLRKLLRFNSVPKTLRGKILQCIINEKTADVANIIDYCKARYGVALTAQQVYQAVYNLRLQGLIKEFEHAYKAK